ncbi:MAG TPA: glycoside hydrolase family 44 protein [Verrucomicrobiae bacterium]|nr:glycoside hydrolase family 44 protein [Verrucomicrobiae bacterium]
MPVLAAVLPLAVCANQIIYDDALESGWQDWGWATHSYTNASPVHSGDDSVSVTIANAWDGLQIVHASMDDSAYTNINFWLNGGSGGQKLQVYGLLNIGGTVTAQSARFLIGPLVVGSWQQFKVPLSALGIAGQNNFSGFVIQDALGTTQPTFYVDDITLQSGPPPPSATNANVTVQIDALMNRHPINPLIYGVAFATTSSQLSDLNVPIHRSGGNATTRYNWQINAANRAADWYFESIAEKSSVPGGDGDDFIQESKTGGAQAMLTIPIIGWVAKLGANRASLASYSTNKYGLQTGNDPFWTDAGNGISQVTGLNITNNDPADANMIADTSFQAGWVRHLTNEWGMVANGGLRYYIMDNEWSIWHSTHRDVHPIGATMDEVLGKFCDYATMVKNIDPDALIAGPEEWGWSGYFYSGFDQQWSGAHNDFNPAHFPDRAAHGGQDFGPWFLSQLQQRSHAAGKKLLDIFSLHYYPQGGEALNDDVSTATQLLRNRSTRSLWDTNYVDASWINSVVMLIPRMKSWVAANYPGTLTAITEYNWGADDFMNGATAQADILGIFGREGLDIATRWTCPGTATPVYNAFKMYRNYDGNKSTFGNTSIRAAVPNPDNVAVFAAVRTSDGAMTVMVINKDPFNATPVTLNIANFPAGTVQLWQLASGSISHLADLTFSDGIVSNIVPAQSITLFVLPAKTGFDLRMGKGSLPGQTQFWLDGQAGQSYVLQSSADLAHWTAMSTNMLSSNSFPFSISTAGNTVQFYRGLWLRQNFP